MLVGRVSFAQNFTQEINYQGKLTDTNGVAVPDGTYNMRFWLLSTDSIATTSAEWAESLTGSNRVQVTSGLFSIMLGSSSPLTSVDFNQPLYLGVEIGGTTTSPVWDGEMSPRKVIGAVPAAFEAKNTQTFAGIATTSFLRSDLADTMSALLTFSNGFLSNASSSITELNTTTTTVTYLTLDGQTFTSFTDTDSGLTNTAGVLTANISEGNLNITGGTPTDDYFLVSSSSAPGGFVWSSTSTLGLATTDSLHAAVTLETSTADYLTLSGQEITLGLIDLANDVTGTLASTSIEDAFLRHTGDTMTGALTMSGANIVLNDNWLSGDGANEGLVINSDGWVGVGTSSPQSMLDVWGDFRVGTSSMPTLLVDTSLDQVMIGTTTAIAETDLFFIDDGNANGNGALRFTADGSLLLQDGALEVSGDKNGADTHVTIYTETSGNLLGYVTARIGRGLRIGGDGSYQMEFAESGAVVSVKDGVDFGIGTTTPSSRLAIKTSGTTDILNLFETGGTEVFTVLENGNVGIGTTTPIAQFSVQQRSTLPYIPYLLSVQGVPNNGNGQVKLSSGTDSQISGLYSSPEIILGGPGRVDLTAGNVTGTLAGMTAGSVNLTAGSGLSGSQNDSGGSIVISSGDATNGGTPGDIQLVTGSNGSTYGNIEMVLAGGTVSVGASTNLARLNIQSTSTNDILNLFETSGTEVFTVLESGNVGIGDTSPSYLFTVGSGDLFGVNGSGMIATESVASSSLAISNWTNGYVMLASSTAANGFDWVATSTLGITGSVFSDYGADTQIPFMNGTSDFDYSADLIFDGTALAALSVDAASSTLGYQINGTSILRNEFTNDSLVLGEAAGNTFNTVGLNNVAVGFEAGFGSGSTTASDRLSVLGYHAGYQNTGDNVSAFGYRSGYANSGTRLTAVGMNAAVENAGDSVTAIGQSSAFQNSGENTSVFGHESGYQNTGSSLTAAGYRSAYSNTGQFVTAVGTDAAFANVSDHVTAFGYEALRYVPTSTAATVFGYRAGRGNLAGVEAANLTAFGYLAGTSIETGADNNILIGYQAADSLTTGANNLIIGYDVEAPSNTADGQLNIGNIIFGTSIDETGTTVSDGGLAIGTSSADTARLSIQSQGTTDILNLFETSGSEVFTVLENGNVGINNTNPSELLTIGDNGSREDFSVNGSGQVKLGDTITLQSNTGVTITTEAIQQDNSPSPNLTITTAGTGVTAADGGSIIIDGGSSSLGSDGNVLLASTRGNVGIGTASPNSKLTVSSDGLIGLGSDGSTLTGMVNITGNAASVGDRHEGIWMRGVAGDSIVQLNVRGDNFEIGGGASLDTAPAMVVDFGSDNVGIGTTTPTGRLDIYSNAAQHLYLTSADYQWRQYVDPTTGDFFVDNRTRSTFPFRINQDANSGVLALTSNSASVGSSTVSSARLNVQSIGGSDILNLFETGGEEVFTVLESGNVGIGASTPEALLTVGDVSTSRADGVNDLLVTDDIELFGDVHISGLDAASVPLSGITSGTSGSSANSLLFGSYTDFDFVFDANNNDSISDFNIRNHSTSSSALFTVTDEGNVGIGTTSPTSKLHVAAANSSAVLNATIELILEDGSAPSLALVGNGSNIGTIHFGDNASINAGRIIYDHSDNSMAFVSAGTERVEVVGNVFQPVTDDAVDLGSASLAWDCLYYDSTNLGTCASDERLKNNIADLTFGGDPLVQLMNMRLRSFEWNEDPGDTNYGVIAQELMQTSPELVGIDEETGLYEVNYGLFSYLTIAATQQFKADLDELLLTGSTSATSSFAYILEEPESVWSTVVAMVQDLDMAGTTIAGIWYRVTGNEHKIAELEAENELLQERLEAIEAELGMEPAAVTDNSTDSLGTHQVDTTDDTSSETTAADTVQKAATTSDTTISSTTQTVLDTTENQTNTSNNGSSTTSHEVEHEASTYIATTSSAAAENNEGDEPGEELVGAEVVSQSVEEQASADTGSTESQQDPAAVPAAEPKDSKPVTESVTTDVQEVVMPMVEDTVAAEPVEVVTIDAPEFNPEEVAVPATE